GLGDLDVVGLAAMAQPLVVIVHRNREDALGLVLADHVVVENLADFLGRRHAVLGFHKGGLALLTDDVHAELDALVADEHRRPGDELTHLMLALAAKAAIEGITGIAPRFGGWHVLNAPPLGQPTRPAGTHPKLVKHPSLTPTTPKSCVSWCER